MMILNKNEAGQSLIEIIIALAIGALLVGAASMAIIVVLQSSSTSQIQQSATILGQDIMEKARAFSLGSWDDLYGLTKGSSTLYYFYTTSTQFAILQGKEGIVANDIRDNLVGYWKFDEGSGTTAHDYSDNSNVGTLQGGVTRATSTCRVGYCLDFDGTNDYVDVGDPNNFNTDKGTIAAWVKWVSSPSSGINSGGSIFSSSDTAVDYYTLAFWIASNGKVEIHSHIGGTVGHIRSTTALNVNEWYHLVGLSDGNTYKIYINGEEEELTVAQGTNNGNWFSDTPNRDNVFIGVYFLTFETCMCSGMVVPIIVLRIIFFSALL